MGMATEQKHYSESVLGVENKVSRDVLKINYLGPQRGKKKKKVVKKRIFTFNMLTLSLFSFILITVF